MAKTVFISGATSGLGRALARAVVNRGDVAIGIGRSEEGLAETGRGLDTSRYLAIPADVRDRSAVEQAVKRASDRFGGIDALYANAAIYPRGTVQEQSAQVALNVFDTNVIGIANVIGAIIPGMMKTAHGRIVVVGSFADRAPEPDSWAYAASKGAIHALAKAVATDVSGDFPDILVNEWIPGVLNTPMGISTGIDPDKAAQWGLRLIDLSPGESNGKQFIEDRIVEEPMSLKRKVLRRLHLAN